MFSTKKVSNPALVITSIINGSIIPVINEEILNEYREVLSRQKFNFSYSNITALLSIFETQGIHTERKKCLHDIFPDPDDIVFYEIKMSVEDSYLITGNIKHFPPNPLVVNPAQMVEILKEKGLL